MKPYVRVDVLVSKLQQMTPKQVRGMLADAGFDVAKPYTVFDWTDKPSVVFAQRTKVARAA